MWKTPVQIMWMVLLGSIFVRGNTLQKDIDSDLESRLATVEGLLAAQTKSQLSLRETLRQETGTRRVLEDQLGKFKEEQHSKIEDLSSVIQVTKDRVAALDGTLQEEIRLREEAEIKAEAVLVQLSKKIGFVERDLALLSLLNSRLRELERQKGVQNEEILNLQSAITQLRKSINRERRDVQKLQAIVEPLAFMTSENTKSLTSFDSRLSQLRSWFDSHNETARDEHVILQEVKKNVLQLTESLMDIEVSFTNLTESVNHLHHSTPSKLLKLCPEGYRKVGEDCLRLIESRASWDIARLECEELGIMAGGIGDLAVPTSLNDFRAFVDKIDPNSDFLWIGAKRDEDCTWRWVNGMSLDQEEVPWDLGEPDDNDNQHQLCVRSEGNIKFHDCIADSKLGAICQLV